MGPLERFLLRSPNSLVQRLVNHFNLGDLVLLGALNVRLRYWFNSYRRRNWDMTRFLSRYVDRYHGLLSLMDGKRALIYGQAVLKFFLRSDSTVGALDICTTLASFHDISRLLLNDGYERRRKSRRDGEIMESYEVVGDMVREAFREGVQTWSQGADRSVDPKTHFGYRFEYGKYVHGKNLFINIHLVRCEPYRHVLASPICESSRPYT